MVISYFISFQRKKAESDEEYSTSKKGKGRKRRKETSDSSSSSSSDILEEESESDELRFDESSADEFAGEESDSASDSDPKVKKGRNALRQAALAGEHTEESVFIFHKKRVFQKIVPKKDVRPVMPISFR